MEKADITSSLELKEKSGSEESCSECCCDTCHETDSADSNSVEQLPTAFTKLRDGPRPVLPTPADEGSTFLMGLQHQERMPMLEALSGPVSLKENEDSLKMALQDLHEKQALERASKQRHCAFCKIHGIVLSVKGHKPFCKYRLNCSCKGCVLIRCTQKVSKDQVRLRRLKDLEVGPMGATVLSSPEQQSDDSSKKTPMCFKCWLHDSVRVRLKGHRSLCPYAHCACANCTLNSDRQWLTRQLRQLTDVVKKEGVVKKEEKEERKPIAVASVAAGLQPPSLETVCTTLPSFLRSQQCSGASLPLASAASLPSEHYSDLSDLQVFPFRQRKAQNWPTGMYAFPSLRQNMPGGMGSNLPQPRVVYEEPKTDYMLSESKPWLPGPSSSHTTASPSFTAMSSDQGLRPDINITSGGYNINNSHNTISSYSSGMQVPASTGQGFGSSMLRWLPQHPPPYSAADLLVMPSSTLDFSQYPAVPPYFQFPLQSGSKIDP